jgi:hypothetical protein
VFGRSSAYEGADPEQGVRGEPVTSRVVESLDRRDQPNTPLLEQFSIPKLATRRKLSTDHPYQSQVGSDESLPSQRSLFFEKSQLLVRRVYEAGARYSRVTGQQASLYGALQLDNLGMCQQRFVGRIVGNSGHADTLSQPVPLATLVTGNLWISQVQRDAAAGHQSLCSLPVAHYQALSSSLVRRR